MSDVDIVKFRNEEDSGGLGEWGLIYYILQELSGKLIKWTVKCRKWKKRTLQFKADDRQRY